MIVIADTTPLNYMVWIGEIEVLPKLYGRVIIPPAVCDELKRARAPEAVRLWIARPPAWLEVRLPRRKPDAELLRADLDDGERDAEAGREPHSRFRFEPRWRCRVVCRVACRVVGLVVCRVVCRPVSTNSNLLAPSAPAAPGSPNIAIEHPPSPPMSLLSCSTCSSTLGAYSSLCIDMKMSRIIAC